MYIKMLKNADGAEQGIHVKSYKKGQEYMVSEDLGKALVGSKAAEALKAPAKKEEKSKGRRK